MMKIKDEIFVYVTRNCTRLKRFPGVSISYRSAFLLMVFLGFNLLCIGVKANAQDLKKFNLYKPGENAVEKIMQAQQRAKAEGKHVFIQVGGNWCIWCARFNELLTKDSSLDSLVQANYVVYHLNYSTENKNEKLLEKYRFPQRFGFPVFLVLDGNGNLLHTQNSGYLEQGKGYDTKAVMGFLNDWTPQALDAKQYKEK